MKKFNLFLSLIFSLFLINTTLADIPPPPIGESIRIELTQNYPDYQFYLCSYKLEVKPNPNPPHPSRPNMVVIVPDSFQMKKIDLSKDNPYNEMLGKSRIQNRGSLYDRNLYLVAIEKSQVAELEPKIKESIDNRKNGNTLIRVVRIETAYESRDGDRKGVKVIVNKISMDEKKMNSTVEEGTTSAVSGKTSKYIGLGFLFTGLALIGGWWARKRLV